MKTHRYDASHNSQHTVHRAMRKYGSKIKCKVLVYASPEDCLLLESRLRPFPSIGYNIAPGGKATMLGFKQSKETRNKLSVSSKLSWQREGSAQRRKDVSERNKQRVLSECLRKQKSDKLKEVHKYPWLSIASNKHYWSLAHEVYNYLQLNPTHKAVRISNHFGLSKTAFSKVYKKTSEGWVPSEDMLYLEWLGQYNKEKECNESTLAT
jgi:hypothetical protein